MIGGDLSIPIDHELDRTPFNDTPAILSNQSSLPY